MTTTADTRAVTAAEAAAAVLPAPTPLTLGPATAGATAVPDGFAGAVVVDLDTAAGTRIAVLVGSDLVDALAGSPVGGLDLAAAVQPAADAAAAALGGTAGAARIVETALVAGDLGGPFTVVTLLGGAGASGALLVPDTLLPDAADVPAPAAVSGLPQLSHAAPAPVTPVRRGIEMLHGVDLEVTVELGRTQMSVRELLSLAPGAVLELDRAAGSPADLLVNGRLIARGEVVVVDEDFGLRVTEIIDESAAS